MGTSVYDQWLAQQSGGTPPTSASPASSAYDQWLASQQDPLAKLHADFQSGALQKRNAILNRNDVGAAQDADQAASGLSGYADRLGSMAERAASVVPGGSAVMTAERSAITGEPWGQAAMQDARDAQEAAQNAWGVTVPKGVPIMGGARFTLADVPTGLVAGRALLRFAPNLSPTAAGATYAGLERASNPIPESGLSRAGGTALATAEGAALPAALDVGGALTSRVRASQAPALDENLVARGEARSAASGPLYDQFRGGGDSPYQDLPMTADLQAHLNLPIVRRALRTVQGESSQLNGLSPTNPAVLDAVYKRIGNKAWAAQNGYEAGETATTLKAAIDDAAKIGGNPQYSPAVDTYAGHSNLMDAVERGYRAMQYAASPKGAPIGAIEDSPTAFRVWASDPSRTPAELQAATEGIQARQQVEPTIARVGLGSFKVPVPLPSRAVMAAPDLLNLTQGAGPFTRAIEGFRGDLPTLGDMLARFRASGNTEPPSGGGAPPPPPAPSGPLGTTGFQMPYDPTGYLAKTLARYHALGKELGETP